MTNETRHKEAFDYPELDKISAKDFYNTYRSFMFSIAHKEHLDYYQADMAIDDVMLTIYVKHACHFNPQKGRFSNYLATMVRNASRSLKRREHRYMYFEESDLVRMGEEKGAVANDKPQEAEDIRKCIDEGIQMLRKEVRSQLMVDAFVMTVIDQERPIDVARKLDVRPDYVSLAKNRYLPRFRAIIKAIMEKEN